MVVSRRKARLVTTRFGDVNFTTTKQFQVKTVAALDSCTRSCADIMRVIQDSDDDSGSEIEDNVSKDAPTVPHERVKDVSSGATESTGTC